MRIAALVSAYNEAATIERVVRGLQQHVSTVLVVDDGSTDGTHRHAEAAGVEVLRHPRNAGKGMAIRSGLATLLPRDFSHVLFIDGDLQHDPADAPALIAAARSGHGDLVIGARPFDRRLMPASRYYTNTISSWVISAIFVGVPVRDAQSGFRLIATDLLRRVRLTGRGYEIETEMLIKLVRRGARIAHAPIRMQGGVSTSKLRPVRDTTRTCFLAVRYRFFPESLQ
jgi:glycosyltransferase involved in cell wall biosynthesis